MTNTANTVLSQASAQTVSNPIRLGGTFRLPPMMGAASKPVQAGATPAEVSDSGRIRLGGTFRLNVA